MAVWLRRSARLVPAADVFAVLAVLAVVSAGAMYELISLGTWGTFDPSPTPPSRIDWCGRRYYPRPHLITRSDVEREVAAADQPTRLQQIATAPSGRPVLAAAISPEVQASHHTQVCAMLLYVQVGADRYQPYGLSGGP